MAVARSATWYAVASRAARAMWALVVNRVRPAMTPRASGRQCGANRPEKAGTNTTSPESGTERASASTSSASSMSPSSSRSHCTSDPATATEPSSAYVVGASGPPSRAATVVISPCVLVDRRRPRVQQHEAARAVGALGLPCPEAGLAEQGRMLVAEVAGDRHAVELPAARAVDLGRAADLGEHLARDPELVEDRLVPRARREVHQHRPGRVRHVGHVDAAIDSPGQVPDEPRIDGPEHEIAGPGAARSAALRRSRIQASLRALE